MMYRNGFFLSLVVASCQLSSLVSANEEEAAAASLEKSYEHSHYYLGATEHQRYLEETKVKLSPDASFSGTPVEASDNLMPDLTHYTKGRLAKLFEKTTTDECRALISEHYGLFMNAFALEKPLPFTDTRFNNTCEGEVEYDFDNLPQGVHMGIIQNRTYQPPRNESVYLESDEVVLLYGILAHDSAEATIRLIESVDEPTTTFIVHIDAKYEETYQEIKKYAKNKPKITMIDHPHRVRVNWGGFSMVNATLQLLDVAQHRDFTHFVHIASTAYPIASNRKIRNTLASYPADANFMHVILKPARPHHSIWNYFVECDDRLHRIYRLMPLTKPTHNADIYTSSQWFILSKEFVQYIASPEPGSFVEQYLDYIQHVVVADESFFGTVLRNTHFCHKHHNWNFLHLQFDQWENERNLEMRDERKCVMPDPNHCGRSPTTLTLDYLDILELTDDLYARKFIDSVDTKVKDVIDILRAKDENHLVNLNITDPKHETKPKVDMGFDGHGTLFVVKDTINSSNPLCLGLGETENKVRLTPCFHDWVPNTLAEDWQTGAVIFEETLPHNRFQVGPCSSDGNLKRVESGDVEVTPGFYTPTGPRCILRIMDGVRRGRCLDGESLDVQPGGPVHVFPCTNRWNQFLSFGDGEHAPLGSIHTNVPLHTRRRIAETGREQEAYMCLGVAGRGDEDEEDWFGVREDEDSEEESSSKDEEDRLLNKVDGDNFSVDGDDVVHREATDDFDLLPFSAWEGEQMIATKCSNTDAVVQFVLVPFIVEADEEVLGNPVTGNETEEEEL